MTVDWCVAGVLNMLTFFSVYLFCLYLSSSATLANLALYQQLMSGSVPVPQATVAAGHHQYPQQKEGMLSGRFGLILVYDQ